MYGKYAELRFLNRSKYLELPPEAGRHFEMTYSILRHCDPEFSGEAICQLCTPYNEIASSTPPRHLALSLNKSTGCFLNAPSCSLFLRTDLQVQIKVFNFI